MLLNHQLYFVQQTYLWVLNEDSEFDFAFNVAFKLLKIDCPDLNLPENIDSEEIKVMRKLLF